jgi:hypothetical protein
MPGIVTPQRERRSRKPSCLPNPPMILLTGPEKTGKSWEAARGTSSELIGMTYWIEIGGSEGTADYYGRVPGARYEIVPHDGTYQDILDAVRWAVAQPPTDGKPNMIALDGVSNLWDMLSDEQALYARRRAERKAQENRRRGPDPDLPVTVDPDLWNRAKDRWGEVLWLLRRHNGPTLLLARQEVVTAFENDKPTREKTRRIKAEKNLPAAVDAIVELHALGEAYLTGVRTLHWNVKPGQTETFKDFSIDALLRRLGFHEAAPTRQVTESQPAAYLNEQQPEQEQQRQEAQRREPHAQQAGPPPALTGKQARTMIHKALTDKNNPEECLRAIREEWGVRTLKEVPTITKMWGELNADDLITRCFIYIQEQAKKREKEQAEKREQSNTDASSEQGGQSGGSNTPSPTPVAGDQSREHQPHAEHAPPSERDAPPPPDPVGDEPPPGEDPEETSAAEEPQDVPAAQPAAAVRPNRLDKNKEIARQALADEAKVQARLKMMTVGEHLGPVSEGDVSLIQLRDYLQAQRPALVAQLEWEGHTELAVQYRSAPAVDTQIRKKFAAYFENTPAE